MTLFDPHAAGADTRVLIAWLGVTLGTITLQQVVWTLTAIYTVLQIIALLRSGLLKKAQS